MSILINLQITTASLLELLVVGGGHHRFWDALVHHGNHSIPTTEQELQGAQLSKNQSDMACPHHDVGGSSASSKNPDCVPTFIFSLTLSHRKARAELDGRM